MKKFIFLLSISTLLRVCIASVLWNYLNLGPDYWKNSDRYPVCNGPNQSPINIVSASTIYDSTLTAFDLSDYNATLTWTFRNMGPNTVTSAGSTNIAGFQRDTNPQPVITGANLNYQNTLIQWHLHWGSNDYSGGEHFIDGNTYPLELHFVHSNTNNSQLLMLAFLFELSATNNTNLNDFLTTISQVPTSLLRKNLTFALASILPDADTLTSGGYFYYFGSLTLPPCTEGINWVVFNAKISISSAQLKVFRSLNVASNWRDVQLLNGRQVYSSKNLTQNTTTTSSTKVKNTLGVLGLVSNFFFKIF